MARIKCKQCGKKYSDSKDSCPRCGTLIRGQSKRMRWIVPVVVLLVVTSSASLIVSYSQGNRDGGEKKVQGNSFVESDAEYKSGLYLRPFSNKEALSIFLSIRAMCAGKRQARCREKADAGRIPKMERTREVTWRHGCGRVSEQDARMITAIDSSVILDALTEDPRFADISEEHLRKAALEGKLIVCECVLAGDRVQPESFPPS